MSAKIRSRSFKSFIRKTSAEPIEFSVPLCQHKRLRGRKRSQSFSSPAGARQVVPGHLQKLRAARVAHRVVDEADVRAPAGAPLVDLPQLVPPPFGLPEPPEVVVEVREAPAAPAPPPA